MAVRRSTRKGRGTRRSGASADAEVEAEADVVLVAQADEQRQQQQQQQQQGKSGGKRKGRGGGASRGNGGAGRGNSGGGGRGGGRARTETGRGPRRRQEEDEEEEEEGDAHAYLTAFPHTEALKASLLSEAAASVSGEGQAGDVEGEDAYYMIPEEVRTTVRRFVEDVDQRRCRRGRTPVLDFFVGTYNDGLPYFQSSEDLMEASARSMRTIFRKVLDLDERDARKHLTRLADAFQACQAVQARVLDSVYGQLTGRDRSFREQLLVIVDEQKARVLDQVTMQLHPDCMSNMNPGSQLPHLQSAYKRVFGAELGFPGVRAAQLDYCAPHLSSDQIAGAKVRVLDQFSMHELCSSVVADVNQQSEGADRLLDRDALAEWASTNGRDAGFDPHSIYYDEDQPEIYGDEQPTEENRYQPFLCHSVALRLLAALLL